MTTSWYGPEYGGRPMANGEIYDPEMFVCAHRTLPFGTRLRLSVDHHSVIVRVADRGPFIKGRDLDISEAAAERLGMIKAGVAILQVEVL
jgi:rare lipoprotein A